MYLRKEKIDIYKMDELLEEKCEGIIKKSPKNKKVCC